MDDYEDVINKVEVNTPKCGRLTVFIQGSKRNPEQAILSCHDLGCNHTQFTEFLKTEPMRAIVRRVMWVHLLVPGQGPNDSDLPSEYKFPSLQDIADDIIHVLNHLGVKHVVPFGEGAGANILARFTISHDTMVLGSVFIDLVGHSDNVITKTTRKISVTRKLSSHGMHHGAEEFLIRHRFGSAKLSATTGAILESAMDAFKQTLHTSINPRNLQEYISAFIDRSSIKDKMGSVRCPVLLVTTQNAAQSSYVRDMHHSMQMAREDDPLRRSKVELVVIDDVCNAMIECPARLAECFQCFIQGLGIGSTLVNRKTSDVPLTLPVPSPNDRTRSISMADFDQPRGQQFYRKISTAAAPHPQDLTGGPRTN